MALLGHTARLVVSTENLAASADAWHLLGFAVLEESEHAVRLSDGQILVTLLAEVFESPAFAYFHSDPSKVVAQLNQLGIPVQNLEDGSGVALQPFGTTDFYVHAQPSDAAERHSGGKNDLLGYLDAVCVFVPHVLQARVQAEELGFFVQEEWAGGFPRSDVTDGLMTISLQQRDTKPYLSYATELTRSVLEDLHELDGVTAKTVEINGAVSYVRLTTPEGTQLIINHDHNYE